MKIIPRKIYSYRLLIAGFSLVIAGVLSLMMSGVLSQSNAASLNNPVLDLIKDQDWTHMAGAAQSTEGVNIKPLGRAIVNQDGSDNQDNPPVNVRGPHAVFSNNLQLDLKAVQVPAQGAASFYIYSSVPIIYDEWRYQPPQLRIDLNQQKVTVYVWNGRSDKPSLTNSWTYQIGSGAFVSLKKAEPLSFRLMALSSVL
jgi:endo-1,4-beta-xylanase